ncbi:hypothetical protein QYF36_005981 [Acer negundo]|nr:hypothetical protein QYF36_005981 [Acer negundo]
MIRILLKMRLMRSLPRLRKWAQQVHLQPILKGKGKLVNLLFEQILPTIYIFPKEEKVAFSGPFDFELRHPPGDKVQWPFLRPLFSSRNVPEMGFRTPSYLLLPVLNQLQLARYAESYSL